MNDSLTDNLKSRDASASKKGDWIYEMNFYHAKKFRQVNKIFLQNTILYTPPKYSFLEGGSA